MSTHGPGRDEDHSVPLSRLWRGLCLIPMLLFLSGCVQIDTRVKLHEDGSATVIERVSFSRRLLDLDAQRKPAEQRFTKMLSEAGPKRRMQKMGTGVTLVSHKVKDGENGARDSITVYKIPQLTDLIYMSPLLAYLNYGEANAIRFELAPVLKDPFGRRCGKIQVRMLPTKPAKGAAKYRPGDPIPEGPPPSQMQIFRELGPIVRDMMSDFKVKLVFEAYVPLSDVGFFYRGRSEQANFVELIDFDAKDLDNYGGKFLENEEIMLDLVRWDLGSLDMYHHTKNFISNRTIPVFHIHAGTKGIQFAPSKFLFDKHVAGKMLDFGNRNGGKRKVTFAEVKYKKVAGKLIGEQKMDPPAETKAPKPEKKKRRKRKK